MNKDIVPKDSKYIPLTQQKDCCVPTCIQMIMLRHNISLLPTELIGYYLGLIVPKKDLKYFWNARSGKKPIAGWGTQVNNEKYKPNDAFKKLKLPLKINFNLIDNFADLDSFKNYLRKIEKIKKDIIICYDYGTLFNTNHHNGHVCVLDRVYLIKGKVRIIDPENNNPKWRVVNIKKLYNSMKFHGPQKSGGFWEITVNQDK
jgi:hypothetical protein